MYVESSSKEGINVDSPFEKLATALVNKIKENPEYNLNKNEGNKNYDDRNLIEKNREKEVKCC